MSTDGRILECTVCGQPVRVYEAPREYIDPDLYVCGDTERHNRLGQMSLEIWPEPPSRQREEYRPYDPTISRIDF